LIHGPLPIPVLAAEPIAFSPPSPADFVITSAL
jgi:hypothetical protein